MDQLWSGEPKWLMAVRKWLAFLASLSVVLAAAFFVYQFTAKQVWGGCFDLSKAFGFIITVAGSPVRIVGGSFFMTADPPGWQPMNSCAAFQGIPRLSHQYQNCIVSRAPVVLSGVVSSGITPPLTLPSGDRSLAIEVFARDSAVSGELATLRGVVACVSDGLVCGQGNQIAVAAFDDRPGPSGKATLRGGGAQYDYKDPNDNGSNKREKVGRIRSGGAQYVCSTGVCEIDIGNL